MCGRKKREIEMKWKVIFNRVFQRTLKSETLIRSIWGKVESDRRERRMKVKTGNRNFNLRPKGIARKSDLGTMRNLRQKEGV